MPSISFTRARPSGTQALAVDYSDGSQIQYSLMWLLDSCPSGFHPQTGERAFDLLRIFGLDAAADENATSLAYGSQRRLEIARALATDPQLIALDEPAAGMNATEKGQLRELIDQIRRDQRLPTGIVSQRSPYSVLRRLRLRQSFFVYCTSS